VARRWFASSVDLVVRRMDADPIVVVGAGMAGGRATDALLKNADRPVLMIGTERLPPYNRPDLSKGYLLGTKNRANLLLHAGDHYGDGTTGAHRGGTAVLGVDPERRHLCLGDGLPPLRYAQLLVATGATPRRLAVPGHQLAGIHYLRSADDADDIRAGLRARPRIAIVGSGLIGLEVAAAARQGDLEVDVIEIAREPLASLGPGLAAAVRQFHEAAGVRFHFGVGVERFEGPGAVERIVLSDGSTLRATLVVVGIGVIPESSWLPAAVRPGGTGAVTVDSFGETPIAGIYAAGDVCRWPHGVFGDLHVEHETVAQNQGAHVALNMLGRRRAFEQIPYAWSDQYQHSLRSVGVTAAADSDDIVPLPVGAGLMSVYVRDRLVTGGATLDADRSASRLMKIMRATPALKIDNSLIEQLVK
jgi:3-phenylpropionate/trans-cinnamate dioxygenase ferredoxin reductase component